MEEYIDKFSCCWMLGLIHAPLDQGLAFCGSATPRRVEIDVLSRYYTEEYIAECIEKYIEEFSFGWMLGLWIRA